MSQVDKVFMQVPLIISRWAAIELLINEYYLPK